MLLNGNSGFGGFGVRIQYGSLFRLSSFSSKYICAIFIFV